MLEAAAIEKCSILIVEDEPIVAKDLQQSLREMGYDAFAIASSADDAIKRAAERCPDLALMDIRIKGKRDGIETADILRQQFGISVVYLTAHADEVTIERAKKTEPYGYLLKPIRPAELRSVIEVAVHKHRLDKNLRERERRYSSALRSVADAVVTLDLSGKVTFVNRAAEALLGVRPEAVLGKTADDVLRLMDRDVDVSETASRPLIDSGDDGANENSPRIGTLLVFRDVTEKARLQKQLEFADRMTSLGTMAAGTAHELNNPLTVVVTNAGFVGDELKHLHALVANDAEGRHRMGRIFEALGDLQAAASRMGRVVADLRAFSRPAEQPAQVIDLRRCIEWAIRATSHEFAHRAYVRTKFEATPPVIGESARLEQVLVNLLVNAAHAIAPGRVEQNNVWVVTRTDEQKRAVIEVRDTGAGIPPDVLKKVFEPFFTTKAVGTGTGLGLAICSGIVKSLGGEIQVQSEPDQGTTFSIVLPGATGAAAPAAVVAAAPVKTQLGRILVVDDETTLLRAMQRILEDEGHQVVCTENARDALALCERGERFDVILSDLMMPTMTGLDFYQALLEHVPAAAPLVVFVSGGATTQKMESFLGSVQNLRLQKPFKAAQLCDVVQRVIAQRK